VDPFQGLAKFVLGKLEQSSIALWLRFLFELIFSAVVSFLLVTGLALIGADNFAFAIGTGMVSSAVVMTVVFRKESSRLTKGMFVVLPELEAEQELKTNLETIQKPGGK
jgi:ABC-type multidrug transport system permease subunit